MTNPNVIAIEITGKADGLKGELRLSRDAVDQFSGSVRKSADTTRTATEATTRATQQHRRHREEMSAGDAAARKLGTAIAGIFAAGTITSMLRGIDQFQSLKDRLRAATDGAAQFQGVYAGIKDIANATGSAMEANVALFQRLNGSAKELGATRAEMLQFSRTVQELGVIGGASGQALSAGTMQLSQALAGGILRAEEFNSIMENMPELGVRIAESMGLTVGQLRNAVLEGEVLSKDVFAAVLRVAPQVGAEFAEIPMRLGRATEMLKTNLLDYVAGVDSSVGITTGLAEAVAFAASNFDILGDALVGLALGGAVLGIGSLGTVMTGATLSATALTGALYAVNAAILANPFAAAAIVIGTAGAALWDVRDAQLAIAANTDDLNNTTASLEGVAVASWMSVAEAIQTAGIELGRIWIASPKIGDELAASAERIAARWRAIFTTGWERALEENQQSLALALKDNETLVVSYEKIIDRVLQRGPEQWAAVLERSRANVKALDGEQTKLTLSVKGYNDTMDAGLRGMIEFFGEQQRQAEVLELIANGHQEAADRLEFHNQAFAQMGKLATENAGLIDAAFDRIQRARDKAFHREGADRQFEEDFDAALDHMRGAIDRMDVPSMAELMSWTPADVRAFMDRTQEAADEIATIDDEARRNVFNAWKDGWADLLSGNLASFKEFAGKLKEVGVEWAANHLAKKSGKMMNDALTAGFGEEGAARIKSAAKTIAAIVSLASSFFGPRPSDMTETVTRGLFTGTRVENDLGRGKDSPENRAAVNKFDDTIMQFIGTLEKYGLKNGASSYSLEVGSGNSQAPYRAAVSGSAYQNFATQEAAFEWIAEQLVDQLATVPARLQTLVDDFDGSNIEEFFDELERFQNFEGVLGGIRDEILRMNDPQAYDLQMLDREFDGYRNEGAALGYTPDELAEIEELYSMKRAEIIAHYAEDVTDIVGDIVDDSAAEIAAKHAEMMTDIRAQLAEHDNPFKAALDALNATFTPLRTLAEAAGTGLDAVNRAYGIQRQEILRPLTTDITDEIANRQNPMRFQLNELDAWKTEMVAQATELGIDTANIETLWGLRRRDIISGFAELSATEMEAIFNGSVDAIEDAVAGFTTALEDADRIAREAEDLAARRATAMDRVTGLLDRITAEHIASVEKMAAMWKETADNARANAETLRAAAFELRFDPRRSSATQRLSTLLPMFDTLRDELLADPDKAGGGAELKDLGDRILEAAEKTYGTTGGFQSIADHIEDGYSRTGAQAQSQLDVALAQLAVQEAMLAQLRGLSGGQSSSPAPAGVSQDDWDALNSVFGGALGSSRAGGQSDADFLNSGQHGVFRDAFDSLVEGDTDVGRLQTMLGFQVENQGDSTWGSSYVRNAGVLRGRIEELGATPMFARGGRHRGGLRLVGEQGPELEVTGPSVIHSAQQTRDIVAGAMTDNADLGGMLSELVSVNQSIAATNAQLVVEMRELRKTVGDQAKALAAQDRQIRELSLQRRTA